MLRTESQEKSYIGKLEMENRQLRNQVRSDIPQQPGGTDAYYANAACEQATTAVSPEETIDFLFTFHDDPDKTPHYVEIREAAKQFAKVVIRHTPGGGDRVTAVQKIREAVMFANACVALSGRGI